MPSKKHASSPWVNSPRMQYSEALSSRLPTVEDALLGCWDDAEESFYLWNKHLPLECKTCLVSLSSLHQWLLSLCHPATLVQAPSCPPGRTVGASKQSLHPHSPASAWLLSKWQECVPALSSNHPGASIVPEIASRLQPRVFKVLLSSHPRSLPPKLFVL